MNNFLFVNFVVKYKLMFCIRKSNQKPIYFGINSHILYIKDIKLTYIVLYLHLTTKSTNKKIFINSYQ